jgi:aspartokinase/homoserine dehydrogenase 1
MNSTIVLKFGGTSVGSAARIMALPEIIKPYTKSYKQVIVVCSAMSKVTDLLIKAGEEASVHNPAYKKTVSDIKTKHNEAIRELFKQSKSVSKKVEDMLAELEKIYEGIFLINEFSLRSRDLVTSFGERLSCTIVNEYFNTSKVSATFCDARQIIKTDSSFSEAKVDFPATNKAIREFFSKQGAVVVTTGFIASDKNGITTTLGRGGSDYTAAIVGAAIGADEIQIWTDVNGVMSADPNKVKNAITLDSMTYNEAMEMCYFGAKVIHPPTIVPALEKNIPLRIKNSFHPEQAGTFISKKAAKSDHTVKGITSIEQVHLLTLQGSGMVGVAGISARLFSALAIEKVNVILITQASSEHNISFAVKPNDSLRSKQAIENAFALEIKTKLIEPVAIQTDLSILAVIGENMKNTAGVSGRLFQTLGKNGVSVIAAAQGSSELNISVVVKQPQLAKALNSVHDAFFLSQYKTVNVFVAGVGLIGSKLIEQMNASNDFLKKQHGIALNIAGFADSKSMLVSDKKISVQNAKKILSEQGEKLNEQKFAEKMFAMSLSNSVFVDCTGNDTWSKHYATILANSISIVTPNKTANSSTQAYYNLLKQTATKHNVKFLYETNVGAGLPVINTLNNLLVSGDKIIKIEAILSGTLSFIFNSFNSKTPFSDIVKMAKEKGYTEPDPRDDLSGKDFARKLLILARECGANTELKNINIESILPTPCVKAKSVDDFFKVLKTFDVHFSDMVSKAEKAGKVLRMVGVYENGKGAIKLLAVDATHPFYNLSGSDNIVSFTTERYKERPLVIKGPGAGAEVTAAGVLADIITVSNYLV